MTYNHDSMAQTCRIEQGHYVKIVVVPVLAQELEQRDALITIHVQQLNVKLFHWTNPDVPLFIILALDTWTLNRNLLIHSLWS